MLVLFIDELVTVGYRIRAPDWDRCRTVVITADS